MNGPTLLIYCLSVCWCGRLQLLDYQQQTCAWIRCSHIYTCMPHFLIQLAINMISN